jgi:membrane protein involved in colicin uptake
LQETVDFSSEFIDKWKKPFYNALNASRDYSYSHYSKLGRIWTMVEKKDVKANVKAAAEAVKPAEAKTEAKPAVPEKVEAKAEAAVPVKAEAAPVEKEVKAPAKKTAAKKTTTAKTAVKKAAAPKETAKKETAPKAAAKKETVKKTSAKKAAEPKAAVHFDGKDLVAKDVLDQAVKAFKKSHRGVEIKTIDLYIVANEGAAYYVVNGEGGDDYKIIL